MGQQLGTTPEVIGLSVALSLVTLAWAISLGFAVRYEGERDNNCTLARVDAFRNIDGSGNNLAKTSQGMARTAMFRLQSRVNQTTVPPRDISNAVCAERTTTPSTLSNLFWVYGQFVDHMIALTPTDPDSTQNIVTETGFIPFQNSVRNAKGQIENHLSCFLDGSVVYGTDGYRAAHLRAMDGSGKLLVTAEGQLQRGLLDLPNQLQGTNATAQDLFLAGDERANENVFLTAMHHLWVLEHNRLCDALGEDVTDDERKFQVARRWNIAQMQAVTFYEFLPLLIGASEVEPYAGYNDAVEPALPLEFTSAVYRIGHTMVSETIQVGDRSVGLVESFFNPFLYTELGTTALLESAAGSPMNPIDHRVTDGLRNSLFGVVVHDLAAINIQRGRDHQLGSYTDLLRYAGLPVPRNFLGLDMPVEVRNSLMSVYPRVSEIDLWVGGIAENTATDGAVGPLFQTLLKKTFHKIRDGDRFWFENDAFFSDTERAQLKGTTLGDIMQRHGINVQPQAFVVPN